MSIWAPETWSSLVLPYPRSLRCSMKTGTTPRETGRVRSTQPANELWVRC